MRTFKRTYKKYLKKRTSKKATSVVALSKKVSRLAKQMSTTYETMYLQNRGIVFPAENYTAINVQEYLNCRSIFGTSGGDYSNCNKWKHLTTKMDFLITMGNEENNIDYTMYIVSLKDSASGLYSKSTGVLTLVEGDHYAINESVTPNNAGQTLINPKCFNIHLVKRFTIGNNGVTAVNPTGNGNGITQQKRYGYKLKINKMIYNPTGNMSSLIVSQDASSQYYVLLFNNNQTIDAENNNVEFNFVHTIQVPN